VTTKQSLFREVNRDLLGDSNIGEQHELLDLSANVPTLGRTGTDLFNQEVRLSPLIWTTVRRKAVLVKGKLDLHPFQGEGTIVETSRAELLGDRLQDPNILLDFGDLVLAIKSNAVQTLVIDDILSVAVGQLAGGPGEM